MKDNVHSWQIKKGDWIPDIAKELGLDLSALLKFHNNNTHSIHRIRDDYTLGPWTDWILLPDSVENLKEKKRRAYFINLIQKESEELTYNIIQQLDLRILGDSMIDSVTAMLWKLNKVNKGDSFFVELTQSSHEVRYVKSIYRQLTEYMQKFNKPLGHLHLALSDKGAIENISNQAEITTVWNDLRQELQAEMGNTLEEQNMLEAADVDFTDTLPLIQKNVLYNLFFPELFQEYNVLGQFEELGNSQYISQLFTNEKVEIKTQRKIERQGDIAIINFYSFSDTTKNKHLKKVYNAKLKDFLKEDYDYSFSWSIEYRYNIALGTMLFCQSKIKEEANTAYRHMTEHRIEII